MTLRLVISGGQSGADRTGLECAKRLGIATGGMAPKGYRTEAGDDFTLHTEFGLKEHPHARSYPPRTLINVVESEATIWFGDISSPGGQLTKAYCEAQKKPMFINPKDLREIAAVFEVVNVAGNRKSTNPHVVEQVQRAFATLEIHNGIAEADNHGGEV